MGALIEQHDRDYSQEAAVRLQQVLHKQGTEVSVEELRSEVEYLRDAVYRDHTKRRLGSGLMDRIAGGVISSAERGGKVSKWLIKQGLAYSDDQMSHEQAHGQNLLEHPIVGAAAATAELIPEVAEPVVEVMSTVFPVIGNILAGAATGFVDVGVGAAVGFAQAESYKAIPDFTDPQGKEEITHRKAQKIAIALGIIPTVFANATLGLGIAKGFGRSLMRQLKDHPAFSDTITRTTTRAARIGVGRRHGLHA